jgi:metallo-beta-lactamase family protein
MQITPFGAAKTVTGSCYSITAEKNKVLVDCGMFQGSKKEEKLNYLDFGFEAKRYIALFLTHAHLDHCGRIPLLVKRGFKGKIYATSATRDLAFVVMMDSAKIAAHDISWENKKRAKQNLPPREPIYAEKDVHNAMKLFQTVEYHDGIYVNSHIRGEFFDAGHILGASSLKLEIVEEGKKTIVVFSGDLGQKNTPIVKDPEFIDKADYVFIESTYGDRLHEHTVKRGKKFLEIIQATYDKGGKLMIPSFAIERAQELLYDINGFMEKHLMEPETVYLDSPMAIKATEVFRKHPEDYDAEIKKIFDQGDDPFNFEGLKFSRTVEESKAINNTDYPIIIIAGSGMCTAGRIKHHIKNHIDDPKNTILFVGYQVFGTLGYWIKKGEKRIRLLGTEMEVKAKVETIDSFSAHADYEGLLEWLQAFKQKPKKVFIIHGEEDTQKEFAKKVKKIGLDTHIPSRCEKINL